MHVLHIIESLTTGGKERQLIELARGMNAVGATTTIVVMSDDIAYDLGKLGTTRVITMPRKRRFDLGYLPRLQKLVEELRPDVVHSWGSMCTVVGLPAARLTGVPFVNGIIRDAPQRMSWLNKDYRRGQLTFPFSDVVLANSRAGLISYGAPRNRGQWIHNGFDDARMQKLRPRAEVREEFGITTRYVVAMTASFTDRKDYGSFFKTATAMIDTRGDVTFVAIGSGVLLDSFRREYPPAQCPHIRILGRRGDVESIAAACDIGVLMSNADVHGEGIPNAIMEFMALGKPVIVSASGGVAELVTEGEHGFVIGDKDVGALTDRLNTLLDHPEKASAMGARGAERVRTDFSIDRMIQAHQELYRKLRREKPAQVRASVSVL